MECGETGFGKAGFDAFSNGVVARRLALHVHPLMQAPVPREVDFTEPAISDGAGGGNRTHTPCGTGF
jgi:hypothetical protein